MVLVVDVEVVETVSLEFTVDSEPSMISEVPPWRSTTLVVERVVGAVERFAPLVDLAEGRAVVELVPAAGSRLDAVGSTVVDTPASAWSRVVEVDRSVRWSEPSSLHAATRAIRSTDAATLRIHVVGMSNILP